jgi:outer membrane protein TolC
MAVFGKGINQSRNMQKFIFIILMTFGAGLFSRAQAPEFWTLEQCLDQALEQNLDLKVSRNLYQKSVFDYKQSVWEMGPSVSGFTDANVNFQRSTNQDYQIETGTSYFVNYGIGASLNLFAGFTAHNNIAARRFYKLATHESTRLSEYLLELEITGMYSKVLYQKTLVEVAREKLEISRYEAERIAATLEAGQMEQVAQNEINAAVSSNLLSLNRTENEYELLKLQLAHAIEITDVDNFEISDAYFESAVPLNLQSDIDSLYLMTSMLYPAVQQREYELAYYKKMLQVSKGAYSPTLTMNGGYTSAFYSTDKEDSGKETPFSTQFDKYRNPYLGLSLNIPLLSGRRRDFQTKKSRIDLENAMIALEIQKKKLLREIEEAVFKLEALYLEYQSASDNLVFTEKSYETNLEKYRLGLIGTTDFMTTQNQYAMAKSNELLARYSWLVQKRTLDVFCGEPK